MRTSWRRWYRAALARAIPARRLFKQRPIVNNRDRIWRKQMTVSKTNSLTALLLLATTIVMTIVTASCESESPGALTEETAVPAAKPAAGNDAEGLLPHQQLARDLLRELVEINTTHSSGDTTAAAEAMAVHLRAVGFPEQDVQVLGPRPDKGNLVVRYRGRNVDRKPVLLLAHIDVVEADPADWTLDPFTFVEQDDYYYGRGTTDDKDEAAIHIANLIRLKQEGFQPDRDIIVALTADEEGGTDNGVEWLLANHRDLIDAEYALNEGGGGAMQGGRRISNAVQASEKVYQSFVLEVTNPGGHSSLPVKENAIYRLADALARIRDHDFPVAFNEVTRVYFERSAEIEQGELAAAMRGVLAAPPEPAAVAYLSRIPFYNSRLRTTCVATMLQGGHAENALPQRARATVNCRVLPGEPIDSVQDALENAIGDERVALTPVAEATPSPPSPLTADVLGRIERITEELWPGVPVLPTMSTGATDGLFLRNAGIPVYGVSGLFGDIDDNRAHGQNERILIKSYFEGQEFLYRLTKALSRADTT
jgi:acetylornithine deacetylase/succinyl-diaminopimelate desuccinylase-like protein